MPAPHSISHATVVEQTFFFDTKGGDPEMGENRQVSSVADPAKNLYAQLPQPGAPLQVKESAVPAPGPGEVLLRISHCGVCGSELHILDNPDTFRPLR